MNTSLQLLRTEHGSEYFPGGQFEYERDLVAGALAGHENTLDHAYGSMDQAINAVTMEIQLLREVRAYGVGAYFGYRMGILGSLVGDVYLPFALGVVDVPRKTEIQRMIEEDLDQHVTQFNYTVPRRPLDYVRSPEDYFAQATQDRQRDALLIATDYARGAGYDGFLSNAGERYFSHAVRGVADVWNTVLVSRPAAATVSPSQRALTWYFVNEIEYLLNDKKNVPAAKQAYDHFASLNPGIIEAYEAVGDAFYAAGERQRGVEEWQLASRFSGPARDRIIRKIANHYITIARENIDEAERPESSPRALPDAIAALEQALNVDRTNTQAADLLEEAKIALKEKNERRQVAISLVAAMEKLMIEAENARQQQLYEEAINLYERVGTVAEGVTQEFPEQRNSAEQMTNDADAAISQILTEVLDEAQKAIDAGDAATDDNRFDEARQYFRQVPGILAVIPEDADARYTDEKQKLIDHAQEKLTEVDRAERLWQEEQERLRQQQEQGGQPQGGQPGGGQPGGGPGGPPGGPGGPGGPPMF
jgi:tetratricopeptide (TPR) repeat protein